MKAVNLLPRETRSSRSGLRVDPLLAAGAALTAVVVAALLGGFVLVHSHAASAQKQLAAARTQLAALEAARQASAGTTPTLPTPTVTQSAAPWQSALASALQTRVPWDAVLSQLARVIPANVTVSTVSLGGATIAAGSSSTSSSSNSSAAASSTSSPGSLQLGGTAFSENGVAQLLSRLALVPNLSQVALTSSSADPKNGHVTFEISAQVALPGSAVSALAAGGTSS